MRKNDCFKRFASYFLGRLPVEKIHPWDEFQKMSNEELCSEFLYLMKGENGVTKDPERFQYMKDYISWQWVKKHMKKN